ncbi:ubiquilin-1-like [Opisthocomus hoazin]|uniref:ubiquilin-1-like n=1 Tax=Opisthocomus hoazin TaxID=30419 RepID=UPI003F53B43A
MSGIKLREAPSALCGGGDSQLKRGPQSGKDHGGDALVVKEWSSCATSGCCHHTRDNSCPPVSPGSHCPLLPLTFCQHLCFSKDQSALLIRATTSESKGTGDTSQPVVTMESSNIIKVTVKTLKQKEQFEVAQSSTIQEFKEEVAKRFKTAPNMLFLIFAGKVLKDGDTLSQHGVHSGVSIHVVIRSPKRRQDSLADQGTESTLMPPPSHSNSNTFFLGSRANLQSPCLIHHNLSELLISSQETVARTMENLLSRILSSGLDLNTINNNAFLLGFLLGVTGVHLLGLDSTDVLDLLSSIQEQDVSMHSLINDMVQSNFLQHILGNAHLITSNPQLQRLAEENPEVAQILANSQTIREILEASSNPAIMQEIIRNRDVAMNNLESIPGGYSSPEQLYRETEEPILDAVQEQLGNNPFASSDSNPPLSGSRLPAHTENRSPLPNPWAPRSDGVSDNADDYDGQPASSSAGSSFASPNLGPAAGAVVPNSGEVHSMIQQLTGNPEFMHNLESALTNPNSPAQTLLNSVHISSDGNSLPQDLWAQQLPPEMEDAEISSLLRNPRALQALLHIHLALETLSTEASDFLLSLEDSYMETSVESMDDSAQSSESEDDAILVSDKDEAEDQREMDEEAPQTRFKRQMEQLSAMGFQDQRANLQALIDAEGDISAAMEILAKAPSSDKMPLQNKQWHSCFFLKSGPTEERQGGPEPSNSCHCGHQTFLNRANTVLKAVNGVVPYAAVTLYKALSL